MTKIRINKTDAAFRQINAAIRMLFQNEDIVAVHTIASAAHRIIRDFCESRGDVESYMRFTDWIAEGFERQFWGAINKSANFFKHADRDHATIHEFDDEETDFVILMACKWYRDLGFSPSVEMEIFAAWLLLCRPNLFERDAEFVQKTASLKTSLEATSGAISQLPRREKLRHGLAALNHRKSRSSAPNKIFGS